VIIWTRWCHVFLAVTTGNRASRKEEDVVYTWFELTIAAV